MSTYMVIAFDFGGSSNVNITCVSASEQVARAEYERMVEKYAAKNAEMDARHVGCRLLVELVELPAEYRATGEGHTMFWGREKPGEPRTLMNNNV